MNARHAQHVPEAAAEAAPPGVVPRMVLREGDRGRVIHDECDGVIDLLVTGSRGHGPLQRALLGSIADELAEGSPHPVLVVPRRSAAVGRDRAETEALEVR